MNNIVILDAKTLGKVGNLDKLNDFGKVVSYETTSPAEVVSRIADAEIIITNKVVIDREVMKECPNLKLICISATGMNNVDLEAARESEIAVKNAVGYSSQSVAQHTIASLLQLYNQLNYYDAYVKSGDYARSDIFTHYGPPITELHKKTVGIIGLGNIGKAVARIALGFDANVNYYSTSGKNTQDEYTRLSLAELLTTSDIISIHAPLNEKTQNLISTEQLSLMKFSAILINVGRGGIVNELALANAINDGQIGGACVDVFEREPIDMDNPLLKVKYPEKLVLSPHNAWASIEARTKLIDIVYGNIKDFIEKQN
jgi:lactate dehydrogenase-like 2-hydroxyacid dehydrogenase